MTEDQNISDDQLDSVDWKSVIDKSRNPPSGYVDLFREAKDNANQRGDNVGAVIYNLLGQAFSFIINTNNGKDVFVPMIVMNGRRSSLPQDFSSEDLGILEKLVKEDTPPEFKARIADILWIRKKDWEMAKLAVLSYQESANKHWDPHWSEGYFFLRRAVRISADLGKNNNIYKDLMKKVEQLIVEKSETDIRYLVSKMMQLLLDYGWQTDYEKMTNIAETIAKDADKKCQYTRARSYWDMAFKFYTKSGKNDQAKKMKIAIGESFVKEADRFKPNSYIYVSIFLSDAIGIFKSIGERERVGELLVELKDANMKALGEFKEVSTEIKIDRTEEEKIKKSLKDKSPKEALEYFARLPFFSKEENLKKFAIQFSQDSLSSVLPQSFVSSEGNVVERKPSSLSAESSEADKALRIEIIKQSALEQQLFSDIMIKSGMGEIKKMKDLESAIREVLKTNSFVPQDRKEVFERGLIAGLEDDLMICLHLLIPQIENSIRGLFRERGCSVMGIDGCGMQKEVDLNDLLYRPEAKTIFGQDFLLVLQTLLTEKAGFNLRNRFAHGLLSVEDMKSNIVRYLWWVTLHLIDINY